MEIIFRGRLSDESGQSKRVSMAGIMEEIDSNITKAAECPQKGQTAAKDMVGGGEDRRAQQKATLPPDYEKLQRERLRERVDNMVYPHKLDEQQQKDLADLNLATAQFLEAVYRHTPGCSAQHTAIEQIIQSKMLLVLAISTQGLGL